MKHLGVRRGSAVYANNNLACVPWGILDLFWGGGGATSVLRTVWLIPKEKSGALEGGGGAVAVPRTSGLCQVREWNLFRGGRGQYQCQGRLAR